MPRRIEITIPAHQTDELAEEIKDLHGVVGLRVEHEVSVQPPGDVLIVEVTNRFVNRLLRLLESRGIGRDGSSSISTSEPYSLISPSSTAQIEGDTNDATWEEMEALIRNHTNMSANVLLLMMIAGALATVGLATNSLDVVAGAMVIGPGFEAIVQIGLGAVAQSPAAWRSGLANTVRGYGALIAAAAVTGVVLQALGISPLGDKPTYIPSGSLISYWTEIKPDTILIAALAGMAGAILIATHNSVLTAGAMIAIGLIPSASLVGLGLAADHLDVAAKGLMRWLIEVGIVIATSMLVFAWKRNSVERRKMLY